MNVKTAEVFPLRHFSNSSFTLSFTQPLLAGWSREEEPTLEWMVPLLTGMEKSNWTLDNLYISWQREVKVGYPPTPTHS